MIPQPRFGKVRVLAPPYHELEFRPFGPLPLGSVLVLDLREGEPALEEAICWQGQTPWCPLTLIVRSVPATAHVIELLTHLHGPLALVSDVADRTASAVSDIIQAVRTRADPEARIMFNYVAGRLELEELRSLFKAADAGAAPSRHGYGQAVPRHISRRLLELGPLGAPDWRWLFHLARLSGDGESPVEELARRQTVSARTFRVQVRRYTGVSVRTFRKLIGWEWVLEAALRRWGYLDKKIALAREA